MDPRSRSLSAGERRAETVATILELAAEGEPSQITTAAIAQRMRLTQGALFRHFPNKDAMWQAVLEWLSGELLTRTETAAANVPTALDALQAIFMSHIELVMQRPGIPRLLFGELQRADDTLAKRVARSVMTRYGERLERLVTRGQHEGEIDQSVDSAVASTMFIGMVQGLVVQSLLMGDFKRARRAAPEAFVLYRRALESR
ncbi:MAG: TetR family transcriptional regulator [Pseudomonadales bacterium]|nr:TetR family transcriptional regulator [Pseudomonadales bacterium]